jgi:hypothetical protein
MEGMMINFCKPDCTDRKPGCQSKCETYIKGRAQLDAQNKARRRHNTKILLSLGYKIADYDLELLKEEAK